MGESNGRFAAFVYAAEKISVPLWKAAGQRLKFFQSQNASVSNAPAILLTADGRTL